MSQNSPEALTDSHSPEYQANPLVEGRMDLLELDFETLNVGDSLMLHFDDGRANILTVIERDEDGAVYARLKIGRKSQFVKQIETWEDSPHKIKLKGSCQALQGLTGVEGPSSGKFRVSERAWLGFTVGDQDKEMATQLIAKISYLDAASEDEDKNITAA